MSFDDRVNFAIALEKTGSLDEAVAKARDATARAPKMPRAFAVLGWLLSEKGEHAAAVAALERAIELRPGDVESLERLVDERRALGDIAGATEAMEDLVARDAKSTRHLGELGNLYYELHEFESAVAVYRRAIAAEPDRAELHFNLALALDSKGAFAESIASLERALELKPDYTAAAGVLAWMRGR